MRRLIGLGAGLIAGLVVLVALGAGGGQTPQDGGKYEVAAIFDNAAFVIPGQDVKIAGAKVGSVQDVSLTSDRKARITMELDPGYGPFRSDADCTIQPQSLIGEKFVQCVPGTPAGRPLTEQDGVPTVPIEDTHAPVDLDLVLSTFGQPLPQRAALIISSLGGTLAGRAPDLSATIRRAAPALQQTNKVLTVLRKQTSTVEQLVDESDRALDVLAKRKGDVTDFVDQAAQLTQTTADSQGDLRQTLRGLPGLLEQTGPALDEVRSLAQRGTPALQDLEDAAPAAKPLVDQLGTFSGQLEPALDPVDDATTSLRRAIAPARPTVRRLRRTAESLQPAGALLAQLLTSMRDKGAIEGVMAFPYWAAAALARFDDTSHILPAYLLPTTCTAAGESASPDCDAHFGSVDAPAQARSAERKATPRRAAPRQATPDRESPTTSTQAVPAPSAPATTQEQALAPAPAPADAVGTLAKDPVGTVTDAIGGLLGGGAKQGTTTPEQPAPPKDATQGLLDFLLGG